jgi:hypothetical protein
MGVIYKMMQIDRGGPYLALYSPEVGLQVGIGRGVLVGYG